MTARNRGIPHQARNGGTRYGIPGQAGNDPAAFRSPVGAPALGRPSGAALRAGSHNKARA
ncbi:MAG: hypothetical protein LBE35_06325 [Clostridiales bacterium]|nr:hypothetical protein [Clostridiales bacterium]